MKLMTNTYYYKSPIVAWFTYYNNKGELIGKLNKYYKPS